MADTMKEDMLFPHKPGWLDPYSLDHTVDRRFMVAPEYCLPFDEFEIARSVANGRSAR